MTHAIVPTKPIAKYGKVPLNTTWKVINHRGNFTSPVIIAHPVTSKNDIYTYVQLTNITPNNFSMRLGTWNNKTEINHSENVTYMVANRGAYLVPFSSVAPSFPLLSVNATA